MRAVEKRRSDPCAHLRLGAEWQVLVTCDECGWESRWHGTPDLAWIAFKAHQRSEHHGAIQIGTAAPRLVELGQVEPGS